MRIHDELWGRIAARTVVMTQQAVRRDEELTNGSRTTAEIRCGFNRSTPFLFLRLWLTEQLGIGQDAAANAAGNKHRAILQ